MVMFLKVSIIIKNGLQTLEKGYYVGTHKMWDGWTN